MPLQNGDYVKLTEEEITERLKRELEKELDVSAQPGDLVSKQLQAEAEVLAKNQEEALERVHEAAYLADATGKELDKVVDIIGLKRNSPSSSTGTLRLWRETYPTGTYTIPSGSKIQTSGSDPIEFEVARQSSLDYIDGFEEGNLNNWNGNIGDFTALSSEAIKGNYVLEVPSISGSRIVSKEDNFTIGTTFTAKMQAKSGSATSFQFGVQDADNYIEFVVDENAQDLKLRIVEDGAEQTLSNNDTGSVPTASNFYLEIEWSLYDDITGTLYETKYRDSEISSVSLTGNKGWKDGSFAVESVDGQATALVDEVTTRSVITNIEAINSGAETNVGPNTIIDMADAISGVEHVTNPVATGDLTEQDIDLAPFVLGEDGETDEELRERAFNSTAIGGSATYNAISTELHRIEGVKALTLNRNRSDNTVDGMPPHSFEAIVYGGADENIADTIFKTAAIDSHDVGGVNGIEQTYTVQSDVTGDKETISWSTPYELNADITLDLVVDDTYVGDSEIQSIISNYVGGTDIDGSFVNGLDVGEDIYEAVLKREIVGPNTTGVWEATNLSIDATNDGTDDTTTTASGANVLAVADNEVAITDARDGSITLNTTLK